MSLIYHFDIDSIADLLKILAQNLQKRRLKKGLSRNSLSEISEVSAATIAKLEQSHTISLSSYIALAKALGYTRDIKELLSQPLYNTMEELDIINKNKRRKRGGRSAASK